MDTTRRIPVPGTYNFRDPGGYRADGGLVRRGKLFRSDGLHELGAAGRAELAKLGVRVVIDLRDDFEASVMPDDLDGLDVEVVRFPVFEGSGASQGAVGITLGALYARIVDQHANVVIGVLREIAATGSDGVLVHCTAGKDRTGIVVALALLAVGVDRAVVIEDYALSQANLGGAWLEGMVSMVASYGVPDTPELRVLMGGSPPAVLEATLDIVERKHGSVRQYLLDGGLTLAELATLHHVLVEPG
ncbi:tyrosine-protein phosphatase [Luethyella okanaganae]|uniref:Tyrosine-protein phosphatase n=1 Tax=Luethyella okanaganae TaxID=69372 RepID=A0ABW1VAX4_9MICO